MDTCSTLFRLFTVIALALMLLFFWRLPGNVWTHSVKKSDGLAAPKRLFAGIFLWTATSCFAILFGTAVAEGFTHGVSVFYLTGALAGVILYLLWKRFGGHAVADLGVSRARMAGNVAGQRLRQTVGG
ncbi:hypothetical protein FACS1894171_0480 [Clostridia bacterium]|nr:hypothetical protein FACS1894171_0480 [Clostridia bacterium]